jgi:hypothetical protein
MGGVLLVLLPLLLTGCTRYPTESVPAVRRPDPAREPVVLTQALAALSAAAAPSWSWLIAHHRPGPGAVPTLNLERSSS